MSEAALTRKNQKISFETREQLIHLVVDQKLTIKEAGKKLGLKKSTSKMIIKKFKRHGFITKFKKQKEPLTPQVFRQEEHQNQMKLSQSQVNQGYFKNSHSENTTFKNEFFDYSAYLWPNYFMNSQFVMPMVFQFEPMQNFYL